jgi:hypothetical protein
MRSQAPAAQRIIWLPSRLPPACWLPLSTAAGGSGGSASVSSCCSASTAITLALASSGFSQSPASLGGLFRASIITGFTWPAVLSARALQRAPATLQRPNHAA